jgi:protein FLOWERING LOCUS T
MQKHINCAFVLTISLNEMAGRELITYESPSPTMGIHRIVLVLYQQLGRGTVYAPQVRQNFNLRNFARRFNLGKPVAAMYFNCQRQTGTGGRRFT